MKENRVKRKHVIPPSVCEEWNLYTKILSLEMPFSTRLMLGCGMT